MQKLTDVTRGPRLLFFWQHTPLCFRQVQQYARAQYKGHYKAEVYLNKSQKHFYTEPRI